MRRFVIHLTTPRPPDEVTARLLDADAHTAAVPLTTVTPSGSFAHAGARIVARTGIGPVGLDDPMSVHHAVVGPRGGRVGIEKTGRVVTGRVSVTIRPSVSGSAVDWVQDIELPWLPRVADTAVAAVAGCAYRAALRRIVG